MSMPKELYVGKKLRGTFQHSSFLAGGATSAAGKFTVQKGVLKGNSPSANKQFYSNDRTLSHFAHFAKVYKVWEFFRIQLVKKGVTDKAMVQLEKSVAMKGDSLVSWKIQTTFQSSGNKALQLKYHDTGREKDCLPQVGQWNMMNKVLTMSYWSYPNIMVDRIQRTIRYSATKYLDLE